MNEERDAKIAAWVFAGTLIAMSLVFFAAGIKVMLHG